MVFWTLHFNRIMSNELDFFFLLPIFVNKFNRIKDDTCEPKSAVLALVARDVPSSPTSANNEWNTANKPVWRIRWCLKKKRKNACMSMTLQSERRVLRMIGESSTNNTNNTNNNTSSRLNTSTISTYVLNQTQLVPSKLSFCEWPHSAPFYWFFVFSFGQHCGWKRISCRCFSDCGKTNTPQWSTIWSSPEVPCVACVGFGAVAVG